MRYATAAPASSAETEPLAASAFRHKIGVPGRMMMSRATPPTAQAAAHRPLFTVWNRPSTSRFATSTQSFPSLASKSVTAGIVKSVITGT